MNGETPQPEVSDDKERLAALASFESEAKRITEDAGVVSYAKEIAEEEGDTHVEAMVELADPGTRLFKYAGVFKNNYPEAEDPDSHGIRWFYQVSLIYQVPRESEENEKHVYYYLNLKNNLVKVEEVKADHLTSGESTGLDEALTTVFHELGEMRKNITTEVQLGIQGKPVPNEEIKWLTDLLKKSRIVPA